MTHPLHPSSGQPACSVFPILFILTFISNFSFFLKNKNQKKIKNRYEVAPRSDSEESGSEFEEEVSDFTLIFKHVRVD